MGLVKKKTPEPFVKACNKFVYIEILEDIREKEIQSSTKTELNGEEKGFNKNNQKKSEENNVVSQHHQELIKLVQNAYEAMAGEDG